MVSEARPTRVDLIRHGEHLHGDAICGISDPELSAKGWQQLQSLCEGLIDQGESWDVCISSPRKRCADFAEQLCERLSLELLIEDGFAEIDFGDWEGLSYSELENSNPGLWQEWVGCPATPPQHGGESFADFSARVQHSWISILRRFSGNRILLLSHGGVIRAVFANMFGLDNHALLRFNIPHASHSRISAYHMPDQADWLQLDSHNSVRL
jgi:alpha-ribazole phosphatase